MQAPGFADSIEKELRSAICFQPSSFDVPFLLRREGDVVNFLIHLEQNDGGQYACNYYDGVLRKAIEVPAGGDPLETKMRLVDWEHILEHAEKIEEIVEDLHSLAGDADGKKIADLLKYKYWADTPAEHLVPNLLAFKSQFETNQRFYVSDGHGITTEEAYRFLCNRWVEKKLLAKKRAQENTAKNEATAMTASNGKTNHRKR